MRAGITQTTDARAGAESPAVSVVMPAYRTAPFISASLDSVFAQTFMDFEVVVVNDGSPDTPELERALGPYRPRITYVAQENRGPSAARNAGLALARAPLVAFLDSDDLWLPTYLEEQTAAFARDAALDLVCSDAVLFGDSPLAGKTYMEMWPPRAEVTLESLLRFDVAVITSCVVARREAVAAAGLFDERFRYGEDFDLWARMAHRGSRFGYTRKVLARHRLHAASLTADESRLFEGQLAVYDKLASTLDLSTRERAALDEQVARSRADLSLARGKRRLLDGRYEEAAEALAVANDYYRSGKLRLALLGLRTAPALVRRAYRWRGAARVGSAVTGGGD